MRRIAFFLTALFGLAIITQASADEWPIGCWGCRSWGSVRLLEDRYAIETDPEGRLLKWGCWQYRNENEVIILWMDSQIIEIIEKQEDKYFMQALWGLDIESNIEIIKKIGK